MSQSKTDCAVCKEELRAKYKHYGLIKITCVVLLLAVSILGVLYLTDGSIGTVTEEKNIDFNIDNELDNGSTANTNINTGDNATVSGTIEQKSDIGIYIFLSVVFGSVIIVGGMIYVSKNRR